MDKCDCTLLILLECNRGIALNTSEKWFSLDTTVKILSLQVTRANEGSRSSPEWIVTLHERMFRSIRADVFLHDAREREIRSTSGREIHSARTKSHLNSNESPVTRLLENRVEPREIPREGAEGDDLRFFRYHRIIVAVKRIIIFERTLTEIIVLARQEERVKSQRNQPQFAPLFQDEKFILHERKPLTS